MSKKILSSSRDFPVYTVHEACKKFIIRYEEELQKQLEPLLVEAMKPKWYRAARTRDQAIDILTNDRNSDYYETKLYFGRWDYLKVKQLAALCVPKDGSPVISLSAEDAELLIPFFE